MSAWADVGQQAGDRPARIAKHVVLVYPCVWTFRTGAPGNGREEEERMGAFGSIGEKFRLSIRECRSTRTVTTCGMLAAAGIILGSVTVSVGDYLKIGFSTLPNQCIYALYGPSLGLIFGGALDIVKYIIRPTGPFFPGFTFDAMLAGMIYGISYYRHPLTMKRIMITEFIVSMVCNVFLNTLWISVLYGKGFMLLLPARLLKNILQLPVNAGLFYLVGKTVLNKKVLGGQNFD